MAIARHASLSLAYWLPEFGSYADADGRAVELPEPGADRAMTVIDRGGEPVAALLCAQQFGAETASHGGSQ